MMKRLSHEGQDLQHSHTTVWLYSQINKQDNRKLSFRSATTNVLVVFHIVRPIFKSFKHLFLFFFTSSHLNITFCTFTCSLALRVLVGSSFLWILANTATRSRTTTRFRRRTRCAVRAGIGHSGWRCGSCGTTRRRGRMKRSCSPNDRCLCLSSWTSFRYALATNLLIIDPCKKEGERGERQLHYCSKV